jgi:hypothetical protein
MAGLTSEPTIRGSSGIRHGRPRRGERQIALDAKGGFEGEREVKRCFVRRKCRELVML